MTRNVLSGLHSCLCQSACGHIGVVILTLLKVAVSENLSMMTLSGTYSVDAHAAHRPFQTPFHLPPFVCMCCAQCSHCGASGLCRSKTPNSSSTERDRALTFCFHPPNPASTCVRFRPWQPLICSLSGKFISQKCCISGTMQGITFWDGLSYSQCNSLEIHPINALKNSTA